MVKLYPHQRKALRRALKRPSFFLFMEQGTGKTLVAIKCIEERYLNGDISRVLILCPNSIQHNWEVELERFLGIPYSVERLGGKGKLKRGIALRRIKNQEGLQIVIANFEKVRISYDSLNRLQVDQLIIDEGHKLRNRNSQIAKGTYGLSKNIPYKLHMTGTPICGGPEDLFMQYKIIDPTVLGTSYLDFESRYIRKGGYMNYQIVGYKNIDKLSKLVEKTSFRVRLDECINLPPITYSTLYSELTNNQNKAYTQMKEEMLVNLGDQIDRRRLKGILKANGVRYSPQEDYVSLLIKAQEYLDQSSCDLAVTQIMRLQQISGGFLTLDSGEIQYLGSNKLKLLYEVVDESSGPVVVFVKYVAEVQLLEESLKGKYTNKRVVPYRGNRRDDYYDQFQRGEIDILILQISSGSVGLNLQISHTLVMYSWDYSYDNYVQCLSRIIRAGQKNRVRIVRLVNENTIDQDILEVIESKRKLADKVLD